MAFPESQRVIYEKNALSDVTCELRFPPILKIEATSPAAFQEDIRRAYPLFEVKRKGPELPPGIPPDVARMISAEITGFGAPEYEFASADNSWTVGLTKQSLSLSTRNYFRWEQFKEHMMAPVEALSREYGPAFFRRLGLKYRNIIVRSTLGIDVGTPWSDLLKSELIGELSDPTIGQRVKTSMCQTGIELDDDGFVQVKHFIAEARTSVGETTEPVYVIESDFFFRKRTEVNDVWDRLDILNKESGRLFRWCITERLHEAMGPRVLEPGIE